MEQPMNKGVELLMQRMESHPEEFISRMDHYVGEVNKWGVVISQITTRIAQMREASQISNPPKGVMETTISSSNYPIARHHGIGALPYLSDAEVEMLYAKLMEVQAAGFHRVVMEILLDANPSTNTSVWATAAPPGQRYRLPDRDPSS